MEQKTQKSLSWVQKQELPQIKKIGEAIREDHEIAALAFAKKQQTAFRQVFHDWLLDSPQIKIENYFIRTDCGKMTFLQNGSTQDDTAIGFTLQFPIPLRFTCSIPELHVRETEVSTYQLSLLFESIGKKDDTTKIVSIYSREKKNKLTIDKKVNILLVLRSPGIAENPTIPENLQVRIREIFAEASLAQIIKFCVTPANLTQALALTTEEKAEYSKPIQKAAKAAFEKMIFLLDIFGKCQQARVPTIEEMLSSLSPEVAAEKARQIAFSSQVAQLKTQNPLTVADIVKNHQEAQISLHLQKKNWKEIQMVVVPRALVANLYRNKKDELFAQFGHNPKAAKNGLPTGVRPVISSLAIYSAVHGELTETLQNIGEVAGKAKNALQAAKDYTWSEKFFLSSDIERQAANQAVRDRETDFDNKIHQFKVILAAFNIVSEKMKQYGLKR